MHANFEQHITTGSHPTRENKSIRKSGLSKLYVLHCVHSMWLAQVSHTILCTPIPSPTQHSEIPLLLYSLASSAKTGTCTSQGIPLHKVSICSGTSKGKVLTSKGQPLQRLDKGRTKWPTYPLFGSFCCYIQQQNSLPLSKSHKPLNFQQQHQYVTVNLVGRLCHIIIVVLKAKKSNKKSNKNTEN